VACAAGALNGAIVQLLGINAFIVTLGTMTAIRGLVLIYTDGRSLAATSPEAIDAMRAFESGRVQMGSVILILAALLVSPWRDAAGAAGPGAARAAGTPGTVQARMLAGRETLAACEQGLRARRNPDFFAKFSYFGRVRIFPQNAD